MPAIQPMPTPAGHLQQVQSYRAGGFTIGGTRHQGSVLVLPDVTRPWPAESPEQIALDTLAPILDAEPAVEILVVGLGGRFAMVPAELRAALKARGIVVESMDTRAACRTFNVLLAEDRRVAAALIAI